MGVSHAPQAASRVAGRDRPADKTRHRFQHRSRFTDRDQPVRYLPDFDNVLLVHADRRRIVAGEHRPPVLTSGGIIRATMLVDGFVAGTWRLERTRNTVHLLVEPFASRDPRHAQP